MEDEPTYMGVRPLSGVPPLRRKDIATKDEFYSLMQTKLYAIVEAFLAEDDKDFRAFKSLWMDHRFSCIYHIDFGNITRPEIVYLMLRACLGSLLQALSLHEWSINQRRCDAQGGAFVWHVVACTYALYCTYECQITTIKQKILLDLDAAVQLAKIPTTWTHAWRRRHPTPIREMLRMLQQLETSGAFCKCVRGYSFPRPMELPSTSPPPALVDQQPTPPPYDTPTIGGNEHADSIDHALTVSQAVDMTDIERLHSEYMDAMTSFRLPSQDETKATNGHRRQRRRAPVVVYNMPPMSKQTQLMEFVQSIHKVLQNPSVEPSIAPDEEEPSLLYMTQPPTTQSTAVPDDAALAAILQADLESELLQDDIDDVMTTGRTASTTTTQIEDSSVQQLRVDNDGILERTGDVTTQNDERVSSGDERVSSGDDMDDDGWADEFESELVMAPRPTTPPLDSANPRPPLETSDVELSLSSSSDDDAAFEAEIEHSVRHNQPPNSGNVPPSSVWRKHLSHDSATPVTPSAASVITTLDLSSLSDESSDDSAALAALEDDLMAPASPKQPPTIDPPVTVTITDVHANRQRHPTKESHMAQKSSSPPVPTVVRSSRPPPGQPTARSLARARARAMMANPPSASAASHSTPPRHQNVSNGGELSRPPACLLSAPPVGPSRPIIIHGVPTTNTAPPPSQLAAASVSSPIVAVAHDEATADRRVVSNTNDINVDFGSGVSSSSENSSRDEVDAMLGPPATHPTDPAKGVPPTAAQQHNSPVDASPSVPSAATSTAATTSPGTPAGRRSVARSRDMRKPPPVVPPPPAPPRLHHVITTQIKPTVTKNCIEATPVLLQQSEIQPNPLIAPSAATDPVIAHAAQSLSAPPPVDVSDTPAGHPDVVAPEVLRPATSERPRRPNDSATTEDKVAPRAPVLLASCDVQLDRRLNPLTPAAQRSSTVAGNSPGASATNSSIVSPPNARRAVDLHGQPTGGESSSDGLGELELELGVSSARKSKAGLRNPRKKPQTTIITTKSRPDLSFVRLESTDDDELAGLEAELGIQRPADDMNEPSKGGPPQVIAKRGRIHAAKQLGKKHKKKRALDPPDRWSSDSDLVALNSELGIVAAHKAHKTAAMPPSHPPKRTRPLNPRTKRKKPASLDNSIDVNSGGTSNDEALAELERELDIVRPKLHTMTPRNSTRVAALKPNKKVKATSSLGRPKKKKALSARPTKLDPTTMDESDDSGLAALDAELNQ